MKEGFPNIFMIMTAQKKGEEHFRSLSPRLNLVSSFKPVGLCILKTVSDSVYF